MKLFLMMMAMRLSLYTSYKMQLTYAFMSIDRNIQLNLVLLLRGLSAVYKIKKGHAIFSF